MKTVSLGPSRGLHWSPFTSEWEIRLVCRFGPPVFGAFSDRWCDCTTTFLVPLTGYTVNVFSSHSPYAIRHVMVLARFFHKKPVAQNDDDTIAGDVAAVAVISNGNVASATAKRWERTPRDALRSNVALTTITPSTATRLRTHSRVMIRYHPRFQSVPHSSRGSRISKKWHRVIKMIFSLVCVFHLSQNWETQALDWNSFSYYFMLSCSKKREGGGENRYL